MADTKLADLANSLLTLAAETQTRPPADRRFVSQGEPAFDCQQISVHVVRIRPKLLLPPTQCSVVWTAVLMVVLLRCALTSDENGTPPSGSALHAQNMDLAADGWELAHGLSTAWGAGDFPPGGRCQSVTWGNLEPFTPPVQGGLTGWRMTVEVELI